MDTATFRQAGEGWGWLLAAGVVGVIFGALALLFPVPATYAATLIAGIMLLFVGALGLAGGVKGRGHARRGFLIAYGLLAIVAGLLVLVFPVSGAVALTIMVTVWIAARGVLEIAAGTRHPKYRWSWILLGVVNLILALLVWMHLPWAALALPGVLLGVSFLMSGTAEIVAALAHRRGEMAVAP